MITLIRILWWHLLDFACRIPELYTDPKDGTLSHTRIGMIIAGAVFTWKMGRDMPDSWELWATYLGTVGGYAAAVRWMAGKANDGGQQSGQAE